MLTVYDGENITYDDIGNPLSYRNGISFTWKNGRRLASYTDGVYNITYNYTDGGIRKNKTVNGETTEYLLSGSQIMQERRPNGDILNYARDESGGLVGFDYYSAAENVINFYYYLKNMQGDIVGITDRQGNVLVTYTYDTWGKLISITGSMANTIGIINPFRYRGYYYDTETGFYYCNSRYYDPEVSRFISADTTDLLSATPMALTDKNLYAYCDNNPVVRIDRGGQFWETIFDVISLGASIVEVCITPTDPWAWAGLAGDAIDLIPFATGVGEVTRAVKTTVKVADKATDVVDTAKTIYKTADASSDIRKATGSYEILYKSGKNYIGKGGFNRAITSATRNATKYGDEVTSIMWKSAPNSRSAFIDEYLMQKRFGGVLSSNRNLLTYNKIWSPGMRYFNDLLN